MCGVILRMQLQSARRIGRESAEVAGRTAMCEEKVEISIEKIKRK